jgi:cell division septation protein DedD
LARSVVGDAYLRNFQGNRKIQMGAFSQESSARDLMQQLQQRGIPAQVYNIP